MTGDKAKNIEEEKIGLCQKREKKPVSLLFSGNFSSVCKTRVNLFNVIFSIFMVLFIHDLNIYIHFFASLYLRSSLGLN